MAVVPKEEASEVQATQEERKETAQEVAQKKIADAAPDSARVAAETANRTYQLNKLLDKYTDGMTETEKTTYALWLDKSYQDWAKTGKPFEDEKIFSNVRETIKPSNPDGKKPANTPKGTVESRTSPRVPIEVTLKDDEGEYPLADDEAYFTHRENFFNKLREYRSIQPASSMVVK